MAGRELGGMDIHIQRNGQQMEPYTLEQINDYLAQGALLATDSAWHEGMIEWVQIGRVQGVTIPGKPAVPAVGASCPQCQSSVEDDQVICVKCGHRLKLEDPMEQTMTSHIWEDSPTVPKYDNRKTWAGVSAGSIFFVTLSVIGFIIARAGDSSEQSLSIASLAGYWLFFFGFNTAALIVALWLYFQDEDSPYNQEGVAVIIRQCVVFNLVMGAVDHVLMFQAPKALRNLAGTDIDWDIMCMLPLPVIFFMGIKWFFKLDGMDTLGVAITLICVTIGGWWWLFVR